VVADALVDNGQPSRMTVAEKEDPCPGAHDACRGGRTPRTTGCPNHPR
jgi:hypothetical protein